MENQEKSIRSRYKSSKLELIGIYKNSSFYHFCRFMPLNVGLLYPLIAQFPISRCSYICDVCGPNRIVCDSHEFACLSIEGPYHIVIGWDRTPQQILDELQFRYKKILENIIFLDVTRTVLSTKRRKNASFPMTAVQLPLIYYARISSGLNSVQ